MRYLHFDVVYDVSEVVSGPAITLHQNEVVEVLLIDRHILINGVSEGHTSNLVTKPVGMGYALRYLRFCFQMRLVSASTVVAHRLLILLLLIVELFQTLRIAEAGVYRSHRFQLL